MSIDTKTVYVPNPRVAYRKIGERYVLVDIEDNTMLKLNEVGTEIWSCLDGRSVAEIVSRVCEVFSVTQKQAIADAEEFLGTLVERGLVETKSG